MSATVGLENIVLDWLRTMQSRCSRGYRKTKAGPGCRLHRRAKVQCVNCRLSNWKRR